MFVSYFSPSAIVSGFVVLIGLSVIWVALGALGAFGSIAGNVTPAIIVAALLYMCGGYVAGVVAGHHQVLNALAVGLAFGVLVGFALRLLVGAESIGPAAMSADTAAMGAGVFAVLACGLGGIVSILVPFRRPRRPGLN